MPAYTISPENENKLRDKIAELYTLILSIVDEETPSTIDINQWLLANSNLVMMSIYLLADAHMEATKHAVTNNEEYGTETLKENL